MYADKKVIDFPYPTFENLFGIDPLLRNYKSIYVNRYIGLRSFYDMIISYSGSLEEFSKAYEFYGVHYFEDNSIICREWAPNAVSVSLIGQFNNWDRNSNLFTRNKFGDWELFLEPNSDGTPKIKHMDEIKLIILTESGNYEPRLSPWATYVVQPTIESIDRTYKQLIWNPKDKYVFKYNKPKQPRALKIYECHIGIATNEARVGTYIEFKNKMIPRIVQLGYNTIQMMAIMEHAYYASFGYQVTNFYAVSSRFGTPNDLKELIDECHKHNLYVLLDVVHSHASSNVLDGLNYFDGTDSCFFHKGNRGHHHLWGSRLFNYSKYNVCRFLLSNLRWYLEEYQFDGFRFDGVTSMLFYSHGICDRFSGDYKEYHGENVDEDSILYLILANYMSKRFYPNSITIAEDVSGMPALCRPINEGGIGFDYRLAMGIPDKWVELLRDVRDEDWNMGNIVFTLTNCRYMEKYVAYAECHDQALVGGKSIAFWLMDKEMYSGMSKLMPSNLIIDRGIALHKMIRLITHTLGLDAYLNFIGNEFGHPEWLDFPRSGNNNSYQHARRLWHLVDDKNLKYHYLFDFDCAMNHLEETYHWLSSNVEYVSWKHELDKVIVYEKAMLLFVFNFHPEKSFSDYMVGVERPGKYKIILCTDNKKFGGFGNVDEETEFFTCSQPYANRSNSFTIYIPSRCALIFNRLK